MYRWLTLAGAVALASQASLGAEISLQQLSITGLSPQAWSDVQQLVMEPAGVVPVDVQGTSSLEALIKEKCPGAGDEYFASLPEVLCRS